MLNVSTRTVALASLQTAQMRIFGMVVLEEKGGKLQPYFDKQVFLVKMSDLKASGFIW